MVWTKEKVWELQEMYSNPEYSVKEMAEHFGVTIAAIRNVAGKNLMQRGMYKDIGLKKCTKCKDILPATIKYFHRNKCRKDGLNQCCKKCNIEHANKRKRNYKEDGDVNNRV